MPSGGGKEGDDFAHAVGLGFEPDSPVSCRLGGPLGRTVGVSSERSPSGRVGRRANTEPRKRTDQFTVDLAPQRRLEVIGLPMNRLRRPLVDLTGRQQPSGAGEVATHSPGEPEIARGLRGGDAARESDLIGNAASALPAGHLLSALLVALGDLEVGRYPCDRPGGRVLQVLQQLELSDLVEIVCGREQLGNPLNQLVKASGLLFVRHETSQAARCDNLP